MVGWYCKYSAPKTKEQQTILQEVRQKSFAYRHLKIRIEKWHFLIHSNKTTFFHLFKITDTSFGFQRLFGAKVPHIPNRSFSHIIFGICSSFIQQLYQSGRTFLCFIFTSIFYLAWANPFRHKKIGFVLLQKNLLKNKCIALTDTYCFQNILHYKS